MISIKPLEHLLLELDMTKKQLYTEAGFSKITMDRLTRGENVTLDIIDRICSYLDVPVESVIRHEPGESPRSRKPQKATEAPEAAEGEESDQEPESLQEAQEEPLKFYNPRR